MSTSGVYAIRNKITGAMYIGCSQTVQRRWQGHVSCLNRGVHPNPLLQAAWNSDGVDAFECVVLEPLVTDHRALHAAEVRWLQQMRLDADGAIYNLLPLVRDPSVPHVRSQAKDTTPPEIVAFFQAQQAKRLKVDKVCEVCGKPMTQVFRKRKYCCDACRSRAYYQRKQEAERQAAPEATK